MLPVRPLIPFWGPGKCLGQVLLALLMAVSTHAQETFVVEGRVVSSLGGIIPLRVQLKLETLNGQPVADQPADSRGQFQFIGLERGRYRLTASAEGYETTQQTLDVRRGVGRYLVTVTLTPLDKVREPTGAAISVTDLRAPKKARKAYEKGERAYQRGKLEQARAYLEKAVAEHVCYARAHTRLGMTLGLLGEFAAAETALKKAIECDTGFLEAHVQLGILLNLEKRFEECASRMEAAVRHFPSSWQLRYQLASAYYGQGRYREAEQEYLKAGSAGGEVPPEIHVRLADVYTQLGAYEKAYAELQAYLRAAPRGRFAEKAAAVMRRMEEGGVLRVPEARWRPAHPP